jgi:hypothetical protein
MRSHISRALITLILIPSLIAVIPIAYANSANDDKSVQPDIEARAFILPQCVLSRTEESGPNKGIFDIVSSVIPSAIGVGYSALVNALKKAGDPKEFDQKFTAKPFYLYDGFKDSSGKVDVKSRLGCVLLVVGTFSRVESPGIQVDPLDSGESCNTNTACASGASDGCVKCLANHKIPIEKINALFEAEVKYSEDQAAFVYQPRYFQVADWLQSGREKRKHSYVVTISLAGPGAKKDDDNVQSTAIIDLGTRELTTVYDVIHLPGITGWFAGGVGLTDTDKARIKDLADAKIPEKEAKDQPHLRLRPTTLYASIAETAEGSAFAKTLADILDAAKSDATKAISSTVSGALQSSQTEASDLEKAKTAEEKSYDAYLGAVYGYDKANAASPPALASQLMQLDFEKKTTLRAWCRDWKLLKGLNSAPARNESSQCN